jgi:hypothetical protein
MHEIELVELKNSLLTLLSNDDAIQGRRVPYHASHFVKAFFDDILKQIKCGKKFVTFNKMFISLIRDDIERKYFHEDTCKYLSFLLEKYKSCLDKQTFCISH